MAIDFKTAIQIVPHVINTKKPIMFRGRHGIGKSEVVYQIASKIGLPVIERRSKLAWCGRCGHPPRPPQRQGAAGRTGGGGAGVAPGLLILQHQSRRRFGPETGVRHY